MKQIYFDYAAATPVDPAVVEAMRPYWFDKFYNPSATYMAAITVRRELEAARAQIAQTIGARPAEIIFTAGATEANNLAISGFAAQFAQAEILVSALEHDSVLAPAKAAGTKVIPSLPSGVIDLAWLARQINKKTGLISVMLVNNELGTLQPIRGIAQLVALERRRRLAAGEPQPIYLHTDAAQAANYLDLPVGRLGIDLMSLNGGKIYGPKQTGFLYIRAGTRLKPQIIGGGQEFGLRAGTENIAGAVGLATAFSLAQARRESEAKRLAGLRQKLETAVVGIYPKLQINGIKANRAPHLISASFIGQDNERLMMELDERGVQVAVGSACSAGKGELSHVLAAIGLPESTIKSTLRLSLGHPTSDGDIDGLIGALQHTLKKYS